MLLFLKSGKRDSNGAAEAELPLLINIFLIRQPLFSESAADKSIANGFLMEHRAGNLFLAHRLQQK